MIGKIFLDANIIFDFLTEREPFYNDAAKLISLADKKELSICVSSISFAILNYVLAKIEGKFSTNEKLKKFRVLCEVIPFTDKIIDLSLISEFLDKEDAFQYYSALECGASAIITRNKKDFKAALLPLYTAEEYLFYLISKK